MTDVHSSLILPFVFDNLPVRGKLIRLSGLDENVPTLENARLPVRDALAELLAAAATLMSELKNPDLKQKANVTLQVQTADGPVPLMVAHCGHGGDIKGYARLNEAVDVPATFADMATAQSIFAVTVDYGMGSDPWQSFVQLDKTGVAHSMASYFNQSVQLDTVFQVHVGEVQGKLCCGAMFLQKLPHKNAEEHADDWVRMGHLLATLKDEEVLSGKLQPEEVLQRLFAEDEVRVFAAQPLDFKSLNTRAKMENALLTMGEEQVRQILEEHGGQFGMVCEFTGKEEIFRVEDVERIFLKN